ncbi:MAG: porin [Cyanobacteria bacterium J007]|nr:MAG: porin [Cyanobacteria bacterium J007]
MAPVTRSPWTPLFFPKVRHTKNNLDKFSLRQGLDRVARPALCQRFSVVLRSTLGAIALVGAGWADLGAIAAPREPDPLAQITSVSQLSDVQPTDWAFQALQSLVETYGILQGYPDGSFRGDRALTRYEFAAGLNAFLDTIAVGPVDLTPEDLAVVERLQAEFAAELAATRDRLADVETRLADLDARQFSTTTKLNVLATFNVAAATAGDDLRVNRLDPGDTGSGSGRDADGRAIVSRVREDPSITFSEAIAFFLTTSFTGKDSLITTLVTGNGNSPTNNYTSDGWFNSFGTPVLNLTPTPETNRLSISEAVYIFPVTSSVQLAIGPKFLWSRFFDSNAFTSAFGRGASGFDTYGSPLINDLARSSGAVATWRISEQFELRLGYAAIDSSDPSEGLFRGDRALTTQLTISPVPNLNLRLLYDRSQIAASNGQVSGRPLIGVADDGFGGDLEDANADVFAVNFDWLVSPKFGLFGRYSYGNIDIDPASDAVPGGDLTVQSLQLGMAFPDLGKEGSLATLSYIIPFSPIEGRRFLLSGDGDGGTQYEIEATYYFPVTDKIAVIPSLYWIGNANNFNRNPNIYTGTVRTQFNF